MKRELIVHCFAPTALRYSQKCDCSPLRPHPTRTWCWPCLQLGARGWSRRYS